MELEEFAADNGLPLDDVFQRRAVARKYFDLHPEDLPEPAMWFDRVIAWFRNLVRQVCGKFGRSFAYSDAEVREFFADFVRNRFKRRNEAAENGVRMKKDNAAYYQIPFKQGLRRVVDPAQKADRSPVFVSETPKIFREIGFAALPMMMNARHLRLNYYSPDEFESIYGKMRSQEHAHGLHDKLQSLPKALEYPLAVVANLARNAKPGSVVAITDMNINGKKVVVPVLIETESTGDGERIDSHLVLTVYDSNDWVNDFLAPALKEEKNGIGVFYFDKEKANRYSALSQKEGSIPTDFVHNIAEVGINVKPQTETLSFKKWFADSQVVDENGEPLVVYHGTDGEFTVFDMGKGRANMDIQGAFFSPWKDDAQGYGRNVGAFYLSIKNPASSAEAYRALNLFKGQNYAGKKAKEYLISKGFDGVNVDGEEYIAFYPEQIKSATDNVGTFDGSNPDVRYKQEVFSEDDVKVLVEACRDWAAKNYYKTNDEQKLQFFTDRGLPVETVEQAKSIMTIANADIARRRGQHAAAARKVQLKQDKQQFALEHPLFYFVNEFAGLENGGFIKPSARYTGEDFTGSFISPEWVKYSMRRSGKTGIKAVQEETKRKLQRKIEKIQKV